MAGEYIEFNNATQPALNDTNINRLQQLIKQDIQSAVSGDTLPVGAIMPFGSDTIPDNWLLCDGSAVSRTTYQQLFNTIGTTYGTGDGFTTFNLPNLQGKIPVGKNANDTDFDTLGETGGEKTHTLTINEMPSHNHQREQTGRALYWDENLTEMGGLASGVNAQISWNRDTTNTGGSQPHNNLQPYIVQNYIIKAKQSAGVAATVVDNLTSTSATNALSANQGRVLNEKIEGKIIEDSGYSNTGGYVTYYIKFADGTLIQYGKANGVDNSYRQITFPIAFLSAPCVTANISVFDNNYVHLVQAYDILTTGCKIVVRYANTAGGAWGIGSNWFSWCAIGMWK